MSRALIFDMDGTIADLYHVENWLMKLRAEDASPYREAKPLYRMDELADVLEMFKILGYRIMVVSWGSKGATAAYDAAVRKAKIEWLNRYSFPYDEVHIVPYGTPKHNFIKDDMSVLIDDNDDILSAFMRSAIGQKRIIDAKMNIINELLNLLVA